MADVCKLDPQAQRAAVHADAQRMGAELINGDTHFLDEYRLYDAKQNGPNACAQSQLVNELARIDPDDVQIDQKTGRFVIDGWQLFCAQWIDEMKNSRLTKQQLNADIQQRINPIDYDRFTAEFNKRATAANLPLKIALNGSSQLEVKDG